MKSLSSMSVSAKGTGTESLSTNARDDGLWSVVLAGGEGTRIRPFIQRWLGRSRPKQYCTFVGTRSLLEHTLDRAMRASSNKERTVLVIDRSHRDYVEAQLRKRPFVNLISQPCNRDTAPGIFLPLSFVRHYDPDAAVAIYPSDHFVHPEIRFIQTIQAAAAEVRSYPDHLILLGVAPDTLELEYGWIQPGDRLQGNNGNLRSVHAFVEKPSRHEARGAAKAGALWNTFVMTAKAECLWKLGWQFLPEIMPRFESLTNAIGTPEEADVLNSIYADMPSKNFCADILQKAPEKVGVMQIEGVIWSDWGRPERIVSSLEQINRKPAFKPEFLFEPELTR